MKTINWVITVVVLAAILAFGVYFLRGSQPAAPIQPVEEPKPVAIVEVKAGLPSPHPLPARGRGV